MDNFVEFWTTADDGEDISISDDFQGIWLWKDRNDAEDNAFSARRSRKLYRVLVRVESVEEVDLNGEV